MIWRCDIICRNLRAPIWRSRRQESALRRLRLPEAEATRGLFSHKDTGIHDADRGLKPSQNITASNFGFLER